MNIWWSLWWTLGRLGVFFVKAVAIDWVIQKKTYRWGNTDETSSRNFWNEQVWVGPKFRIPTGPSVAGKILPWKNQATPSSQIGTQRKPRGGTSRPVIFHLELSDWFKNGTRIKFGAKKISPSGFRQILLNSWIRSATYLHKNHRNALKSNRQSLLLTWEKKKKRLSVSLFIKLQVISG